MGSIEAAIATFGKITANLRAVPSQRAKIRELVNPHTKTLIDALNEFIDEAQNKLPLGKTKLVIIVDSLDRIVPTIQEDGRTNHDRIFIDRSQQLKGLDCDLVYTVPISLLYSSRANDLYDNYGDTTILPMIMVQKPDGEIYQSGLDKIKEIISKRIKEIKTDVNLETDIFASKEVLERLCLMSGGHVRQLMQLIQEAINNIDEFPITAKAAQRSITKLRDVYKRTIEEEQWLLLAQVAKYKELENSDKYRDLLFNRCLLEYVYFDKEGELKRWCDVHPLIREIPKFKKAYQQIM